MILIQFPPRHSNIAGNGNQSENFFLENFSLCLQVKQDLGFKGGGVRVGDC